MFFGYKERELKGLLQTVTKVKIMGDFNLRTVQIFCSFEWKT